MINDRIINNRIIKIVHILSGKLDLGMEHRIKKKEKKMSRKNVAFFYNEKIKCYFNKTFFFNYRG